MTWFVWLPPGMTIREVYECLPPGASLRWRGS
jgi:hypothetical protein